jgi:adenosine 3'-phospho 5'-phosphosulfate transporter B2
MKPMEVSSSPMNYPDPENGDDASKRLLNNLSEPPATAVGTPDARSQGIKLVFCFVGLQISYLTWGVMQERIMTTKMNPTPLVPDGMFPSPTFCVFSNRFLAIIVAAAICYHKYGTLTTPAPLWYYTPCAISNTISSWGQYAALKYVSFPMQVLFKSAKVIPVMLMGKFLNNAKYQIVDYLEAVVITGGVAIFGLSKDKATGSEAETQFYGLICLTLYVCSDAFTSQWQDRINKAYETSTYQMMFGVNCSAIVITISALVIGNELPAVFEFISANPAALYNNIITAVTSATGQMFIFYTIKNFGPVVFTIMMTTRQMISMVISTILFGHHITPLSYFGAFLVFSAIFYRVYRKQKAKKSAVQKSGASSS